MVGTTALRRGPVGWLAARTLIVGDEIETKGFALVTDRESVSTSLQDARYS